MASPLGVCPNSRGRLRRPRHLQCASRVAHQLFGRVVVTALVAIVGILCVRVADVAASLAFATIGSVEQAPRCTDPRFFAEDVLLISQPLPTLQVPVPQWQSPAHLRRQLRWSRVGRAAASSDSAGDAIDIQREAELAAARAAAARAKADLAAAKAAVSSSASGSSEVVSDAAVADGSTVHDGLSNDGFLGDGFTSDAFSSGVAETVAEEPLSRPARLLRSTEGSALVEVLARLEATEIPMGAETGLAFALSAALSEIYKESSTAELQSVDALSGADKSAVLPGEEELPPGIREDLRNARSVLTPDVMLKFMTPPPDVQAMIDGEEYDPSRAATQSADVKRDWRPFARALARAKQPVEMLEKTIDWEKILPDPLVRASGITRSQAKATVLDFVRASQLENPGEWTDAEYEEARQLVSQEERLRKASARMDKVVRSMGQAVSGAFTWIPLLFTVVLLALVCACVNLSSGNGGDGVVSNAPVNPSDLQSLPLLGLDKKS